MTRRVWLASAFLLVPGDIVAQQWETPKKLAGSLDIHSTFLPSGSQYEFLAGFTGLVIKITSVDPKDG